MPRDKLSEVGVQKKNQETKEVVDQIKLNDLTKEMLEGFLKEPNQKKATTYLANFMKKKERELQPNQALIQALSKKMDLLKNWCGFGGHVFDNVPEGTRKPIQKDIQRAILNLLGIGHISINFPENQKSKSNEIEEFKTKNPIQEFKKRLLDESVKHPKIAEYGNFLKREQQMIPKELAEYNAVIATLLSAAQSNTFDSNTGKGTELFLRITGNSAREKAYIAELDSALNKAIQTKQAQEVKFDNKAFNNLPSELKRTVESLPPEKLYKDFIDFLQKGNITPKSVEDFIASKEKQLQLEKLPMGLRELYLDSLRKMKGIASNDVLYTAASDNIIGFVRGTTMENFLAAVESARGKGDGAIGYSGTTYQFFTVEEMKSDIMKNGVGTGLNISAWKAYTTGLHGNFDVLKSKFGKDSLEALSIYLKNREWKSDLLKTPGLKDYLEAEVFNKLETSKQPIQSKDLIQFKKALNLTEDFTVPADGNKINVFALYKMHITDTTSPAEIEKMKKSLEEDLHRIATQAEKERENSIKNLSHHKNWGSVLSALDIDGKPSDTVAALSVQTKISDKREVEFLLLSLNNKKDELRKGGVGENKEQISVVEESLKILRNQLVSESARTGKGASEKIRAKDISTIVKNPELGITLLQASATQVQSDDIKYNMETLKKDEDFVHVLEKYGLPQDLKSINSPVYYQKIIGIITKIEALGNKATSTELQLLNQLRTIREWHHDRAYLLEKSENMSSNDTETKRILSESITSFDTFKELSQNDRNIYKHIASFTVESTDHPPIVRDLSNIPPGTIVSLSDIRGFDSSSAIGDLDLQGCKIAKTDINSCTVILPKSLGVPPAKDVPINSIHAYLSQALLMAGAKMQSLIPYIDDINREITKRTGKQTSSKDTTFDIYEISRNMKVLFGVLGINYESSKGFAENTNKLLSKYPSSDTVRSTFVQAGILRQEGGLSKVGLHSNIEKLALSI